MERESEPFVGSVIGHLGGGGGEGGGEREGGGPGALTDMIQWEAGDGKETTMQ